MALTLKILLAFVTFHLLDLDPSDKNLKLGIVVRFGNVTLDTTWTLSW